MKQTNFEHAIEVIGQAVYQFIPDKTPENDITKENIESLINCATDGYVLVQWPDSQEYMEEDWFDEEAILSESSSYFIPIKRLV